MIFKNKLSKKIDQYDFSTEDKEKIKIGFEIIYEVVLKTIIVFSLAFLLGTLKETVLAVFTFAFLRLSTFGLHSKKPINCTIVSIIVDVIIPHYIRNIEIHRWVIFSTLVVLFILICIYAPQDTENHPLIGIDFRRKLKIRSIISAGIVFVFCLITKEQYILNIVTFIEIYVVICILPITYKILKRRRNNYEDYE